MKKDNTLAIIIPSYNEEKTIGVLIDNLYKFLESYEKIEDFDIIVINDGSVDQTAINVGIYPDVILLTHGFNRGIGAAVRTGLQYSENNNYDIILKIDADLQHDINDLDAILNPIILGESIEAFRFREALVTLINLARLGNKYLAETEPWKLQKEDMLRTETILNVSLQIVASLAILSEPFMPFTANKLKNMLNLENIKWPEAGGTILHSGHKIKKAQHLFTKIEDSKIQKQLEKLRKQI